MTTMLFKNGTIVDGTGKPSFIGSLLVEGSKIIDVIQEIKDSPEVEQVVDCDGLIISPGFIDMHSHSDWMIPWSGHHSVLKPLVEQGITTIIGGNCGISPAPMVKEAMEKTETLASIVMPDIFEYQWKSMDEYLKYVDHNGSIVNMAELVGHATIRYNTNQRDRGDMNDKELNQCLDNTRQALDEGACGLSFGLGYDPGMYSSLEELTAFCKVASEKGKTVTIHTKAYSKFSPCYHPLTSFSSHNIRALKEAIALAEVTGVRLQLSHFMFVGRKSWSTVDKCLKLIEDARNRGVDIMIDAFPYTCGNTTILVPFPYWFLAKIPEAYSSPLLKARLKLELTVGFKLLGFSYRDFQVMDVGIPEFEEINGLRLSEVAKQWHCSPFDVMLTLAEKSKGAALMLYHTFSGEPGNEEPLEKVLSKEYCLFETDVAIKASGFPNPATMGTFPSILGHFVRDRKLINLVSAIHRMTGASAKRFGLRDTGTLEKNKAADIVCFNANTIAESYQGPSQPADRPKGIQQVYINGTLVVKEGEYIIETKAGRTIRC